MSDTPLPLPSIARQLKGEEHRLSQLLSQLGGGLDAKPEVWRALVERAVVCLHWAQDAILTAAAQQEDPPKDDPAAALPKNGSEANQTHAVGGLSSVVPVFSAMQILCELEKDGALRVEAGEQNFEVLLEGGRVVYAHGDRPAPGERLGEILVRHTVLTEAELNEALQRAQTEGKSVGTVLMRDGLVSPEQLTTALTEQALAVFARLHTAGGARWYFEERATGEGPEAGRIEPARLAPEQAQQATDEPSLEVAAADLEVLATDLEVIATTDSPSRDEPWVVESDPSESRNEPWVVESNPSESRDEPWVVESNPSESGNEPWVVESSPNESGDEPWVVESDPIELDHVDRSFELDEQTHLGTGETDTGPEDRPAWDS
jgi:hypothetical protein